MQFTFETPVMQQNARETQCLFAMQEGDMETGIFTGGIGEYVVVGASTAPNDPYVQTETCHSMPDAIRVVMAYLYYDYLEGDDQDFVKYARKPKASA